MIMPDITKISMIFSERSRALILIELLGGARTTGELAKTANIKPQTANYHLNKMVEVNILENKKYGKNSYYKIKNRDIAKIIEKLIELSNEPKISSLKESIKLKEIKFGRLCYDHIAGKIGVELFKSLNRLGYIEVVGNTVVITKTGKQFFSKNAFLVKDDLCTGELCYDWSEKNFI